MTHADIVRVFTYNPVTPEQEGDLVYLHSAAKELATCIYQCVAPQAAQQAIQQLVAITSMCRTAIETAPRQSESKLVMMS